MAEGEIKINELPVASGFTGVFAQDAGGTNVTEQVNSAQVAEKLKETYDLVYTDQVTNEAALLLKADKEDTYTKTQSDEKYKKYNESYFCLYLSASEDLVVSPTVYASPSTSVATQAITGFTYAGGSLIWNGETREFYIKAEVSYSCTGTNTTSYFYFGKNWTSDVPSETNSVTPVKTSASDIATATCSWVLELSDGDTLDFVANADSAQTITLLTGKFVGVIA